MLQEELFRAQPADFCSVRLECGVVGASMPTSEEALQQAQAEGLLLRVTGTGYFGDGVSLNNPSKLKPYQTQVSRGGKKICLGQFATPEAAVLSVAHFLRF